ncbi:hypothetical protein [Pantoea phage Nafs113]|nr:hypothetical protein [Pantoea phage Nafs113]
MPVTLQASGRWQAKTRYPKRSLGTFDTEQRAAIAVRLFEYWLRDWTGGDPDWQDIPRKPETRDAI